MATYTVSWAKMPRRHRLLLHLTGLLPVSRLWGSLFEDLGYFHLTGHQRINKMITLYIQCASPESEARRLATYLRDADLPFRLTGDKCAIQNHYEPEFDIYIVTQAPTDLNYTVSRSLTDGTIHFTADWVTQCLAEPAQTKPEDELHIPSEALISYADSSKSHTPFLNPDQTAIVIDIAQRLGRQAGTRQLRCRDVRVLAGRLDHRRMGQVRPDRH